MRINNPPRKINSDLRSIREIRSNKPRRPGGWVPPHQTTLGKVLIGLGSLVVLGGIAGGVAAPFLIASAKTNENSTMSDTTQTTTTATTATTTSATSTTVTTATTTSSTSATTTTTPTTSTTSTTSTATTSTSTTRTTSTSSTTTTTPPVCTPFWKMPSSDQGTNLTYFNVNTQISGAQSRSGCVLVRASAVNADNIIFDIGSQYTTFSSPNGCNTHFALSVIDSGRVTVYAMCAGYDDYNIAIGQSTLYDGNFHQLCATYESTNAKLCIYQDLYSPQCLTRTNAAYNTGLGDIRIGWWPDGNRQFISSGGGLIKSMSIFNTAINQSCVAYLYQNNFPSG